MRRREALTALAMTTVACGGGNRLVDPAATPETENFTSAMTLLPGSWDFGVARFDARAGNVTVAVRIDSPVALTWAVGLRFLGTGTAHDEGAGGLEAQGPGPILTGRWTVGFTGRYEAFVYLPSRLPPLPVPANGVTVPLAFSITHN